MHLITSSDELLQQMREIDSSKVSSSRINQKKLALIRQQIRIWKKVCNQDVPITITQSRKQRPIEDLVQELAAFIESKVSSSISVVQYNPLSLVNPNKMTNHQRNGLRGLLLVTVPAMR